MAVTSQIARIRVGPNVRNKTTIYTATKVTGPTGNPPKYSTEIIRYSDAKGSNATVIGTQDSNNPGKITWNDSASATEKKYQTFISKASTNQVNSIKDDIATTAQEKAALNAVSGSNNTAVNSGTDSAKTAAQTKTEARQEWDPNFGKGQRDDFQSSTDADIGVSDNVSLTDNLQSKSAAGTRNSFGGVLVYPSTLRKEKQDTIWFTMMEYKPKELGPSNGMLSAGERTTTGRSIGKVVLPIPGGISDNNTTSWQSGSMNAAQMALAKIALTSITEGLKEGGKEGANILGEIGGGANADDVKKGLAQQLAGAATGDNKQLMQRTTGQVMNPNMEMLFSGPGMRTFTFAFNFTARSAAEGRTILKIIRFFKQGMAPIKSESNLFLKSPHTFKLEYKNGSRTHKALNRFKECACTSCGLQYTPDGNYATYEDGLMTKYTMSLGFAELEPIYNSDYSEGGISQNEIGY
tara:strand:- start:213 stop:1607 length:1395 start_codon:yes stop_codon:yes gene_type:complete